MKVLVTGGAGFIGSHLVDALLARGDSVRVLDSLDPQVHGKERRPPEWLDPRAELQVGAVEDRAAVARALDGVDAVCHLAAAVGVGQSMYEIERYVAANSLGAAVLLEEIVRRKERLRRVVVASSMSIYGEGAYRTAGGTPVHPDLRADEPLSRREWEPRGPDGAPLLPVPTPESKPLKPTSVYAVTKRDHEELFLCVGAAYRIPTTALRFFNVYGPRQALSNPYTGLIAIFSSRLMNGHAPVVFEDGLQTRDFVEVSDIVQAILLSLDREAAPGRVFNVGTGRATSVLDVARVLGRAFPAAPAPVVEHRYRAGDIRHCFADISAIRRDLGYEPRVTLERGIERLLAWLRGRTAEDRVEEACRELERRGLAR
jgi:dTDP-L-rhamnose 4-epimerase